jgi:hypothetical protein
MASWNQSASATSPGVLGIRLLALEPCEAFAQVLHRVVVALRLAVALLQRGAQRVVSRRNAERAPGFGPVRVQRFGCHGAIDPSRP